jgi:hypothetical protein
VYQYQGTRTVGAFEYIRKATEQLDWLFVKCVTTVRRYVDTSVRCENELVEELLELREIYDGIVDLLLDPYLRISDGPYL